MSELVLHAGPFEVLYQNGFLRHISYGGQEALRMIYFALRDENWATSTPVIENEKVEVHGRAFTIRYDCSHEINRHRVCTWKVQIQGSSDGSIVFDIDGLALADFKKNRAGFCVLHPLRGVAGEPCELLHPDGTSSKSHFPKLVSPENPFINLRGMRWKCGNIFLNLAFEGDIFETEDQRNWTDASFKTFCTPQRLPIPGLVRHGEKIQQRVTFRPESVVLPLPSRDPLITISVGEETANLPEIGIADSSDNLPIREKAAALLGSLSLKHYRIDIPLHEPQWSTRFLNERDVANRLGLPLELVLHVTDAFEEQIAAFLQQLSGNAARIKQILFLTVGKLTTADAVIRFASSLKKQWPSIRFGAGTDHVFVELNRNRFNASDLDFVSFSIDPQQHATDDLTIIENMEGEGEVVRTARSIFPDQSVHISSLTLRKRFNPHRADVSKQVIPGADRSDPRQLTPWGAAFTAGSIKALAIAKARSLTLYQTVGAQGILSPEGNPYPIYDVLKEIRGYDRLIVTQSSQPLVVDSLLLVGSAGRKHVLVNYSDKTQRVLVEGRVVELESLAIVSQ